MDRFIMKNEIDEIYNKIGVKKTALPSTRLNTGSLKNGLAYSLNKKKINNANNAGISNQKKC